MFPYTDPVGAGRLQQEGDALLRYRIALHAQYVAFARLANSGFTLLDAFADIPGGVRLNVVSWQAFPQTSSSSDQDIDMNRFTKQDEYVEWQVERRDGVVTRITYTTEFPEYFESLASVGLDSLINGIRDIYPTANPNSTELFGAGFNPKSASPDARAAAFRLNLRRNPWNNGQKGILCLTHGANTLGALFNLVGRCAVPKSGVDPAVMCEAVSDSGACGPGRASDPAVCTASQNLVRSEHALTLADPAGIQIKSLGGIWKQGNTQIDINDTANAASWNVSRNGRRGVLDLSGNVTHVDSLVRTGAEVARVLTVSAVVLSAPDDAVPPWARLGQESSRVISE